MKFVKKASIGIAASLMVTQVFAAPTSTRNTLDYKLGGYAVHTITTFPAQPYQPVYAWRTHTKFNGLGGIHTQDQTPIGETDLNGTLVIVVQGIPHEGVHCGYFINERVAVGDPKSIKSNSLSYTIDDNQPHPGPMHPDIGCGSQTGGGGGGGVIQ